MNVSSEKVGDGKRLKRLMRRAERNVRVRRVLADGAYDQGQLQLPRRGGDQARHQGEEGLRSEEQRLLREEEGGHRAAGLQTEGLVEDAQVRVQVEGRRGVLCH
jgi:hypothetical protein